MTLTDSELERYSRQLALSEWGGEAQQRLRASSAIVVGAGVLGAPAAMYLVAAGVGRLGIVDPAPVALSDLNRQPLHFTPDVGLPKAENAAVKLRALNPEVEVDPYPARLEELNAEAILAEAHVVLDCARSIDAHQAVDDACHALGTPFVVGTLAGLRGSVLAVVPGRTACYRCAGLDSARRDGVASAGDESGFGAAGGVVGSILALEAMKLATGVGRTHHERILHFDGATLEQSSVEVERRADCPVCARVPASAQST